MRAVVQDGYGSPDRLTVRDVPVPEVADDEVLVRVRAASLHPDVWHVVVGRPYALRLMGAGLLRPKQPVPGTDVAGVVESVGAEVTAFRPGDEVFGETVRSHVWCNGGAFAEYARAPAERLAPKPANVTFEQAASLPTSGYIALQNLRGGRLVEAGSRVLVNGAGGGVGSVALQLCKAWGAHVTAVDAPGKLDLLRALGADEVVDYTVQDFTDLDARWDLVFDVPGNRPFPACRRVLEPDGKYVLIGHEGYGSSRRLLGLFPRFAGIIVRSFFVKQLRLGMSSLPTAPEVMGTLAELMRAGDLTPRIDSAWPLEEVREAFRRMVEDELRGKVVLVPVTRT